MAYTACEKMTVVVVLAWLTMKLSVSTNGGSDEDAGGSRSSHVVETAFAALMKFCPTFRASAVELRLLGFNIVWRPARATIRRRWMKATASADLGWAAARSMLCPLSAPNNLPSLGEGCHGSGWRGCIAYLLRGTSVGSRWHRGVITSCSAIASLVRFGCIIKQIRLLLPSHRSTILHVAWHENDDNNRHRQTLLCFRHYCADADGLW